MGYFDVLNKELDAYLSTNYKEDEEIQAILNSYQEWEEPKQELFEAIDRELLYEFMEVQGWYHTPTKDEIEDLLSDEYINYFTDCDLISLLEYFTEITFIELLSYVYIYKYNEDYYAVWDI